MCNTYGYNLYAPVAPNAVQHTLEVECDSAGFDPIYDANENVEEATLLNLESDGPQEVSAQEHSDVQAALFDDTDNNILSR